ncbi:MAG TPA: hypothetical protein VEB59_10850, partial [Gemmatimonadales bacterium]|nr:hypothetical protein [Gemmatimonadales bacterium]
MRMKIFRWKAIGPLLLFLALVAVVLWLFAEPVARDTTEEVSTELLGTQVDVARLDIIARDAAVDLGGLQIADPFDVDRNLIQAETIRLKLNPEALAEKKLVIERFSLQGMLFGTRRETPARPVEGGGFAPQALRSVRDWAKQFDVPLLELTPLDTIRQLALDPTKLGTIRAAQSLAGRADSVRRTLEQGFQGLDIRGTVDTARALAARLGATDPKQLGLEGTRRAIEDVRRSIGQVEQARARLAAFERQVKGGADLLGGGLGDLDAARRKDYAFA